MRIYEGYAGRALPANGHHILQTPVTGDLRAAVDVILLGRYCERFADHAVENGRRVIFHATGATPN